MVDLGCGNGILSFMLAYYRPAWQITGLEIQEHLVKLAIENLALAALGNIEILHQDLKNWETSEKFDLIISNPPYHPQNSGRISPIQEKAISRHEISCTMLDILSFIKKHLKTSGKAYLIYPSNRKTDMVNFAKKVDLNIDNEFFFNKLKKEKVIFSLSQRK